MRFKGKHRVKKADLKEDRFQQLIEKVAEAYYRDRQRFWIIGAVVVAVLVGGILLLQNRGRGVNTEADLRFTEALGIYSQGQYQQAEEAFKAILGRFRRDYNGIKARYYLGQIHYINQRFEEAKSEFTGFLAVSSKNPVLSPAARMAIGDCELELGNPEAAAEQYQRAAREYPDSPLATEARVAAGKAMLVAGSYDRAEEVFLALLDDKPTGDRAEEAKLQLAHVRALKTRF